MKFDAKYLSLSYKPIYAGNKIEIEVRYHDTVNHISKAAKFNLLYQFKLFGNNQETIDAFNKGLAFCLDHIQHEVENEK